MTSPSNRTISELVGDAFAQFAKLVSNEFELARAEMQDKLAQAGRAAAMIAAGAVILVPGLIVLLLAAAAALVEQGFAQSTAYLIVGACTTVIAAVLIGFGISRMSGDALKPTMTIAELERDGAAAREMIR